MKPTKKTCAYCGRQYAPNPRTAKIQKSCSRVKCRRARQRQNYKNWWSRHPGYEMGRRLKKRGWSKAFPDYWKLYRANHPDYVKKDNRRRKLAQKRARRSANQITMRQIAVDKLRAMQRPKPAHCSANQIAIARRMDDIVDYLLWTLEHTRSANQNSIGHPAALGA